MLEPLRFAYPYYSRRAGRLAFSTVATALQSVLVIPALLLVRHAFDTSIPNGDVVGLIWIGAAIVFIRAATSGLSLLLRAYMLRTTRGAVADLRADLLARLYGLSRRYFTRADYANLHTRIVQDTERIEAISHKLFSVAFPALLAIPVLAGVLLYLDWRLVLLGLVLLPLLWLVTRITSRHVRNQVFQHQRAFERFSKSVLFAINHIDLTRVRAFESEEVARQRSTIDVVSQTGHRMAMAFATHGQVQNTMMYFGGICLLVVGGATVASGGMTIGELLAFFVAANQLGGYANTVLGSIPDLIAGSQSFATLRDIMTRGEPEPYRGTRKPDLGAGITIHNVTFAYDGAPVLRDISLSLPPASNVAIIGPNGAGKSTLLHLLLGFYRPESGALAVGDLDYDEVDMRELRRGFGLVPQHPAFFNGTVWENVAYGFPDATVEQVIAACRRARADEFIQRLPQVYETPIGERGFRLSGGECQRLAVARALLGEPRVLVLDEPTNHLDVATVGELMRELTSDRRTVITISHDPEVVQLADTVYHLAEGNLVRQQSSERESLETGTHERREATVRG
jgi:ABC-type multidrug transport system fused ATPase/permease subunit